MAKTDISSQIESRSDFYQPAVYDLLSFYQSLQTESDALEGQFIPLTTVQSRSSKDCKVFAVGLIPPPSNLFNRRLNRSESVNSLATTSYEDLIASTPDASSSSTGDLPGETSGVATSLPAPAGPKSSPDEEFFTQYVVMCNSLGCDAVELAKVIQSESGWDPSITAATKSGKVIARGLIQFTKIGANSVNMPPEVLANFEQLSGSEQLPWIKKFYEGRAKGKNGHQLKAITFGGYNNPGGSIYHSRATELGFKDAKLQELAYEQNKTLDREKKGYLTAEDISRQVKDVAPAILAGINKAKEKLGMSVEDPLLKETNAPASSDTDWQDIGSDNASYALKTAALVADTTKTRENLGKRFMEAQEATIRLMQDALEVMANTPPLRLLINPASFTVSAEKVISDGNWGRSGPIIEHWGDAQDKIEGSGKVAAFFSMDAGDANGPGLSRTARQFSASYQNLLSLWMLYKNNGGVYFPDPVAPGNSKATNLSVVGSVYLYYDEILYIGSFDSFNLTESETSPFTLEYNFAFTVRAWYLLDHLDDTQYTYGEPPAPVVKTTSGTSLTSGINAQIEPNA